MQAGRDALAAKKYDEAIQAFTAAKQLMPADTDAARQLMYAEDTKIKVQAEQKRKDDYARQMTAGRTALAAKKYDDAQRAFTEALKLQPNDVEATRLLKQAQDATKSPPLPPPLPKTEPKAKAPDTKSKAPEKAKAPDKAKAPPATYAQQMQAGAALERQQKYADAAKAYQEALKAVPGDAAATRRTDYAQHMDAGTKFLQQNKKPDAAREFEAALKSAPNDAAATRALQEARRR
jgi:tetratricopeptide (TPR) repeat protein